MAIIKCKMCGGDLNIVEGASTAQCEYCGRLQTVPMQDDEKKLIQFERAERLRKQCEFDKAAGIYETIVADFRQEAEAYWGLVLCKFGIEYVDDPATGKKIPTCHRSSFDSILDDSDFDQAQENADPIARKIYREEAKQIEEIRKGIIAVSANEEPYDIFICYKETDANGDRTLDSVLAQDIYDALTNKGYQVFFSRITLEEKLGLAYEPYIFAALNSAKIMLAVGTDYEHYNAVWVKNEWGRFLKLMVKDKEKHLIPCFKGIDAYDMPKEFAKLQAQDMSKLGFMQDLVRGIEKLMPKQAEPKKEAVQQSETPPIGVRKIAIRTICIAAATFCVIPILILLLINSKYNNAVDLMHAENYEQAINKFNAISWYKDSSTKQAECNTAISYSYATELMNTGKYQEAIAAFTKLGNYKDCAAKITECYNAILDGQYYTAVALMDEKNFPKAKQIFEDIGDYKDSISKLNICNTEIEKKSKYEEAVTLENDGKIAQAALAYGQLPGYLDASDKCQELWGEISDHKSICAGRYHTVVLKADGKVAAFGSNSNNQCEVSSWSNIIAVSAGGSHTVGLRKDGTVVATGLNTNNQCDVSDWTNIVAISAGTYHTVGLKADGTVVAVGNKDYGKCKVDNWANIIAISAGESHTVGLKIDGTVVAVGDNGDGQCNVTSWANIIAISACDNQTVALQSEGRVTAVGNNDFEQCNGVEDWTDIVAVSAGGTHTIALKSNGKMVAVGANSYLQCNVSDWNNIVAISTNKHHTIGLKKDGTAVAIGLTAYYDVTGCKNIMIPKK